MVDNVTASRGYQLPDALNYLDHDVLRLVIALNAIDSDVAALLVALATKAAAAHTHTEADIENLTNDLAGKVPANQTYTLAGLTDVDLASIASGMFLRYNGSKIIPVKFDGSMIVQGLVAAQFLAAHGHAEGDVTGLVDALAAINTALAARAGLDAPNILTKLQTIKVIGDGLILDTPAVGQEATLGLSSAGVSKWKIGKGADDSLFIYDAVNGKKPLLFNADGSMAIGEAGKALSMAGPLSAPSLTVGDVAMVPSRWSDKVRTTDLDLAATGTTWVMDNFLNWPVTVGVTYILELCVPFNCAGTFINIGVGGPAMSSFFASAEISAAAAVSTAEVTALGNIMATPVSSGICRIQCSFVPAANGTIYLVANQKNANSSWHCLIRRGATGRLWQ